MILQTEGKRGQKIKERYLGHWHNNDQIIGYH